MKLMVAEPPSASNDSEELVPDANVILSISGVGNGIGSIESDELPQLLNIKVIKIISKG
jgi:hypothetical protein